MKPTIYKSELIGLGSLNLMAKPMGGSRIEQDFADIRAFGIDRIVSLLEKLEAQTVGLENEQQIAESNNMEFLSYPIPDMKLPMSVNSFALFTKQLHKGCEEGVNTVLHCHAGIGRTGMVAAGILLRCGYSAAEAFSRLSAQRGVSMPDTPEQYDWVVDHAYQISNTA